jgi:hypothetical protein
LSWIPYKYLKGAQIEDWNSLVNTSTSTRYKSCEEVVIALTFETWKQITKVKLWKIKQVGKGWGTGEEMTQTMYAHMNKENND